MSDYMFVLESHLSGEQNRVLALVRTAAETAGVNLFLTGGAMRDMMGGFPIRDLDFTVEGAAVSWERVSPQRDNRNFSSVDETRKSVELRFPGDVTASISMARQERYPKPAAKPQVLPATIHEDLLCRDFTVNAIALSLTHASRGLLLDPANGLGDLACKELRAISNHALYDDPSRILRLLRLKVRLGFTVDSRTWSQYQNVREAKLETKIPDTAFQHEARQIALDPQAGEILKALSDEKLLDLMCPACRRTQAEPRRLSKAAKSASGSAVRRKRRGGLVRYFSRRLIRKTSPKERVSAARSLGLDKEESESGFEARDSR